MLDLKVAKGQAKIVVAMSGGVDSSTVAALLKEDGYNVIGITLQLYDHGVAVGKKGACCAGKDIYDAKMVASQLQIPHYVLDYESKFKQKVINEFVDSYIRGETPLPCVNCNQTVKFCDLLNFTQDLGADALVTGHYVQRVDGKNGPELHRALDKKKDQSYFLFTMTKNQLEYLYFPLGKMSKEETRYHATRLGLEVSDKPESQDICFVPEGSYADLVKKIRPESEIPGKIMHIDGYVLGKHKGIVNYTIGQRRRLGVSIGEPLYVIKIDPNHNLVYVGPESALLKSNFIIENFNWLGDKVNIEDKEIKIKIRSTHEGINGTFYPITETKMHVRLFTHEKAITPGQACVMYWENRVLGGGWISKEEYQNN